jgi:hypothetical protein
MYKSETHLLHECIFPTIVLNEVAVTKRTSRSPKAATEASNNFREKFTGM